MPNSHFPEVSIKHAMSVLAIRLEHWHFDPFRNKQGRPLTDITKLLKMVIAAFLLGTLILGGRARFGQYIM